MQRTTVALATAAIAAGTLAMAAPAQAALSATVGGSGLSITGDGTRNQVGLDLQFGPSGLEWRVSQICILFCAEGVQPGPGCRAGANSSQVVCDRAGRQVTVALGGANDSFSVGDATTVTDPIVVNGQTGNDSISGGEGPDSLQGGSGDDKLRAGLGADTVEGSIGQDLLTGDEGDDALDGGDGNDVLDPGTGADTAEGQAGDDTIHLGTDVKDGKDTVNGGIGRDAATYAPASLFPGFPNIPTIPGRATAVRIVEANLETLAGAKDFSEGDVLRSIESYTGGRDEDIITGVLSSNISDYFGDTDDDTIFGTSAPNTIVGGQGDDQLSGKAGDDIIDAKTGEVDTEPHNDFVIDCGDGSGDTAFLDLKDDLTPTGCEFKERSPLGEGPHVRLKVPKRTAVAGGRATFRLACPRALKRACAGTLRLQLGRVSSRRTAYSIRPGRSKRVPVRLGGLGSRIRSRTKAALVSFERGIKGAKTTERPAVISAP
jgi:Ca2+-binding RTX toxin-like protein